ncbi:energy-converting hydrogenase subunit EhaL family protein [Methanococcus sp. CF]
MNQVPFMLLYCAIAFVIGSALGLSYSYKKYSKPYVEKTLDNTALLSAIIGGLAFTVNAPISVLFLAFPLGMRPGYGHSEFCLGIFIALIGYILLTIGMV